jgi:hypothetical protein
VHIVYIVHIVHIVYIVYESSADGLAHSFGSSGQSNMALPVFNTFSVNASMDKILTGGYKNIRLFQYGSMGNRFQERAPAYSTTAGSTFQFANESVIEPRHVATDVPDGGYAGGGGFWWNLSYAATLGHVKNRPSEAASKVSGYSTSGCMVYGTSGKVSGYSTTGYSTSVFQCIVPVHTISGQLVAFQLQCSDCDSAVVTPELNRL